MAMKAEKYVIVDTWKDDGVTEYPITVRVARESCILGMEFPPVPVLPHGTPCRSMMLCVRDDLTVLIISDTISYPYGRERLTDCYDSPDIMSDETVYDMIHAALAEAWPDQYRMSEMAEEEW